MCALPHARVQASRCQVCGSVQASPKISSLVLNAATNVHTRGTTTSSDQITSAAWESPVSAPEVIRRPVPAVRRAAGAGRLGAALRSISVVIVAVLRTRCARGG